ncbi:hypothetical protein V8D89_002120 [Ganoderma adspersum]
MASNPRVDKTVRLLLDVMLDTYFPAVDESDAFLTTYPKDRISRIHAKLQDAVKWRPVLRADMRRRGRIVPEAWIAVDADEALCPGYLLNVFETHADTTRDQMYKVRVCGALIPKCDNHFVQKGLPNWFLDDLTILFKRGGAQHDPWGPATDADPDSKTEFLDELESHVERYFYSQHRTGLFMLLVTGAEFRVIRWDRSGRIVTEALNYVESPQHTNKLLRFLYAYSQATSEQRGIDTTATRLSEDSCGWKWMLKLAAAHPKDLDYADGTVLDSVPEGFVIQDPAQCHTDDSPLFSQNVLAEDLAATTGFSESDFSSYRDRSEMVAPVFKYVRDFFRESIPESWTCYSLKVCGRHYLVGKPIFASRHLVGRGTRGYVALEWRTQRFVFLKDVWRPSYHGVDPEGTTLQILHDAHVPFVPTLVCHEDVGGGQETGAPKHSSTGKLRKRNASGLSGVQEKDARPIAPMPSRPFAARSGSIAPEGPAQTASTSGQNQLHPDSNATDPEGREAQSTSTSTGKPSRKRARSQTTEAPAQPSHRRSGLRHLTHYRIVVAEVCLPSSAFTSGKQLVRLLWNCIDAHSEAVEQCNILHRDVSVGNILILPMIFVTSNKTKGQRISVVWCGVLSDWELAKKRPDANETSKSLQWSHRAVGTFYYMSVRSTVLDPGSPVSITDELESFFHVLLYLALRYLRSNWRNPGIFIDQYFTSSWRDVHGNAVRGHSILKQIVVCDGQLAFHREPVTFLPNPPPSDSSGEESESESQHAAYDRTVDLLTPSPLNHLIADLLDHFRAHYAIMKYNAAIKARELLPPEPKRLASESTTTGTQVICAAASSSSSSSSSSGEDRPPSVSERRLLSMRQRFGDAQTRPMAAPLRVVDYDTINSKLRSWPPEIREPSDEEKDKAARLGTHEYVRDLFFSYIRGSVRWPKEDYVGDQLEGHGEGTGTGTTRTIEEDEEDYLESDYYY